MEIHELNSKALTDPAYIAVDDGSDTYKFDIRARFDNYDGLAPTIAGISADVTALQNREKVHYFTTSSAAGDALKVITVPDLNDFRVGDYMIVMFENGNTKNNMDLFFNPGGAKDHFGQMYFYDLTEQPTIKEGMALMFYMRRHTSAQVYDVWHLDYVGPAITSGGGGGGTSDYTDLSNKPQINSVTLSGNKSLADLGIDTYIDDYIADNYEDGDSAEY